MWVMSVLINLVSLVKVSPRNFHSPLMYWGMDLIACSYSGKGYTPSCGNKLLK